MFFSSSSILFGSDFIINWILPPRSARRLNDGIVIQSGTQWSEESNFPGNSAQKQISE
jgi:hypothetical protein